MDSEKVKEIKKALEFCSNHSVSDCSNVCPYDKYKRCRTELTKDSLTLINELESENERLNKSDTSKEESSIEYYNLYRDFKRENQTLKDRIAELEDKIEDGTLKEVVRCKDCVYFQPEYVEMKNKERRPYTKEEIKNGKFVSLEKGINCGSRCERFRYWDENQYPVWFNENDFCSYGKPKQKHG